MKEKVITGVKIDATKAKEYNGKTFYSNVVFDDQIMIFWLEQKDKKTAIYAESYSSDLKQIEKLQKVYEIKQDKVAPKIRSNKKAGSFVIILYPSVDEEGQEIVLDYVKVKSDLTAEEKDVVKLPFDKEEGFKDVSVHGA